MIDTLRFITCGSVDDGKSTLIGRLLYDTKLLFEDHLDALRADSKKYGTLGDRLDFALLVDGLQAEREQSITIDVAYRFFTTPKRRFIVADTPGHDQYTRNMATGASTAQAAVLLTDARKGLLTQTKRHSRIMSMIGISHIVLAVNKMDLVDWSQPVFDEIELAYRRFAEDLGFQTITAIPLSALEGHNVVELGHAAMPWYEDRAFCGGSKIYRPTILRLHDRSRCQCNGSTVQISISADSPAELLAARWLLATLCVSVPRE